VALLCLLVVVGSVVGGVVGGLRGGASTAPSTNDATSSGGGGGGGVVNATSMDPDELMDFLLSHSVDGGVGRKFRYCIYLFVWVLRRTPFGRRFCVVVSLQILTFCCTRSACLFCFLLVYCAL